MRSELKLVVPTPKWDESFEIYKSLRYSLYMPAHTHSHMHIYTQMHTQSHTLEFLNFKKENRIALKSVK